MNILIIGGGPGGYVAAISAAKNGANVTLVEKNELGGTCLNRGCIPAKTILHTANLFREMQNSSRIGIEIQNAAVNFKKLMQRKDTVVLQLRKGVEYLLSKNKVTLIRGMAKLISVNEVEIDTEEGIKRLTADKIIIASGSKPSELPIVKSNGNTIINSDHALALNELPKSMIIAGGGVIGCEFAQAFVRLGCEVTLIEMLPRLIANMDLDLSAILLKILKADGVDVKLGCRMDKVADNADSVEITFNGGQSITAEKLMIATGRSADAQEINAKAAGVYTDARGYIPVDECMRTNVEGIYAIGDITGNVQLAHAASHQGLVAIANIFGKNEEMDYASVPFCIYTTPELASMGVTEQNARENGLDIKMGMFPVSANGRSLIEDAKEGFAKTIARTDDGTIIGIHLAGPNVTEMISGMASIFKFQATVEDVSEWIFAHPTVSEIVHESVLDVNKKAIHKV